MAGIELDLTRIVALWIGGMLVLVPFLGLLARYGIVPVLDALARYRAAGSAASAVEMRERCIRLERRLVELTRAVERLGEKEHQF